MISASLEAARAHPAALRLLVRLAAFPALEAPYAFLRKGESPAAFFQANDLLLAQGLA
jgi:hypothetical protein